MGADPGMSTSARIAAGPSPRVLVLGFLASVLAAIGIAAGVLGAVWAFVLPAGLSVGFVAWVLGSGRRQATRTDRRSWEPYARLRTALRFGMISIAAVSAAVCALGVALGWSSNSKAFAFGLGGFVILLVASALTLWRSERRYRLRYFGDERVFHGRFRSQQRKLGEHALETEAVLHALAGLPEDQRRILLMTAKGMTRREIANELGVNVATVDLRLRRAMHALRTEQGHFADVPER
jgi:RNA polymerase sigma factor (sigma-70 family)